MKKFPIALAAALLAPVLLTGCIGQSTIHATAVAPTETEAKDVAKAQLDEQAKGHAIVTSIHYNTKVLPQPGASDIYQVTASERIK